MTQGGRAKTSTGDWCKPTKELPNGDLAQLLHRTRNDTSAEAAVIVDRPPPADPAPRARFRTAELNTDPTRQMRTPRVAIRRLTDGLRLTKPRQFVYPTAPSSYTWVWPLLVAAVAAVTVALAIVRPF
jgi:hypothetical protein